MQSVIDYLFLLLNDTWDLILSNWILSLSFLIIVISFIVGLINGSNGNN